MIAAYGPKGYDGCIYAYLKQLEKVTYLWVYMLDITHADDTD